MLLISWNLKTRFALTRRKSVHLSRAVMGSGHATCPSRAEAERSRCRPKSECGLEVPDRLRPLRPITVTCWKHNAVPAPFDYCARPSSKGLQTQTSLRITHRGPNNHLQQSVYMRYGDTGPGKLLRLAPGEQVLAQVAVSERDARSPRPGTTKSLLRIRAHDIFEDSHGAPPAWARQPWVPGSRAAAPLNSGWSRAANDARPRSARAGTLPRCAPTGTTAPTGTGPRPPSSSEPIPTGSRRSTPPTPGRRPSTRRSARSRQETCPDSGSAEEDKSKYESVESNFEDDEAVDDRGAPGHRRPNRPRPPSEPNIWPTPSMGVLRLRLSLFGSKASPKDRMDSFVHESGHAAA